MQAEQAAEDVDAAVLQGEAGLEAQASRDDAAGQRLVGETEAVASASPARQQEVTEEVEEVVEQVVEPLTFASALASSQHFLTQTTPGKHPGPAVPRKPNNFMPFCIGAARAAVRECL